MAIAVDATADSGLLSTSPASFNHTCTGANLLLVVGVFGGVSSDNVTSVTYNSVALTQIGKVQLGTSRYTYLYALLNPATGTHSVTVTWSLGGVTGAVSASYTGVSQSGLPDASGTNSATATSLTGTLTVIAANSWMVMVGLANTQVVSPSTGATTRQDWAFNSNMKLFDSNGALAAGSQSMTFTATSSNLTAVFMSFAPVATSTLFRLPRLVGLGSGGPFFQNPLNYPMLRGVTGG